MWNLHVVKMTNIGMQTTTGVYFLKMARSSFTLSLHRPTRFYGGLIDIIREWTTYSTRCNVPADKNIKSDMCLNLGRSVQHRLDGDGLPVWAQWLGSNLVLISEVNFCFLYKINKHKDIGNKYLYSTSLE